MKSFNLICLIFLSSFQVAFGNQLEFDLIGTDYSGIFHFGNTILIYGKYGVITYSKDLGINWKQISIGHRNDVLKIISVDKKLYALTPEKIFVSKDSGQLWEETLIHWENNFIDFCTDGNQIFIITENEILSIDKDFKSDLRLLYQFDPFVKFTEMVALENYLFIIDAKKALFKFNILTKISEDTIYTGYPTRDIENLKIKDTTIYVTLLSDERPPSFKLRYQMLRHSVLYTKNYGKNWEIFAEGLPITKDYILEKKEAHTLSPKLSNNNSYFIFSYVRTDNQGVIEEIDFSNPNTWIPYFQWVDDANTFQINAIERVNDSIIVACGNNKTIIISRDNGKNWTFVSYFRPTFSLSYSRSINQIMQKGKDTIVVLSSDPPYMFVSSNGGATFKTLGIDTNFRKLLSIFSIPIAPPKGKLGYFTFRRNEQRRLTDTVMTISLDYLNMKFNVDTFLLVFNNPLKMDSVDLILFYEPIYLQNKTFLVTYLQKSNFSNYLILVFDDNLKLIDTSLLSPSEPVPLLSDDAYLYSFYSDTINTYVLRKSMLKTNWEIVGIIPQVSYKKANESVHIDFKRVVNNLFIFNKTTIASQYKYELLLFDKTKGHLNSLEVPSLPKVFSFGDTIFVLTENWLRAYPNLINDTSLFSEYQLPSIEGTKINRIFRLENQDYISLEKKYGDSFDYVYEGNYGKLKLKTSPFNIVIEKVRPFLFCAPPYPNPASDYINFPICWDKEFLLDNINFTFFNINGQKFEVTHTLAIKSESNCGVTKFFLNNLLPGLYFINVNLQNSELTVPFIKF